MWDNTTIMMLLEGVGATLYMTVTSTLMAYVFGLPMGILLVLTRKDGLRPNAVVN